MTRTSNQGPTGHTYSGAPLPKPLEPQRTPHRVGRAALRARGRFRRQAATPEPARRLRATHRRSARVGFLFPDSHWVDDAARRAEERSEGAVPGYPCASPQEPRKGALGRTQGRRTRPRRTLAPRALSVRRRPRAVRAGLSTGCPAGLRLSRRTRSARGRTRSTPSALATCEEERTRGSLMPTPARVGPPRGRSRGRRVREAPRREGWSALPHGLRIR